MINKMICIKQIFSKKNILEIHDCVQLANFKEKKTTKYPLIGEISDRSHRFNYCQILRTQ